MNPLPLGICFVGKPTSFKSVCIWSFDASASISPLRAASGGVSPSNIPGGDNVTSHLLARSKTGNDRMVISPGAICREAPPLAARRGEILTSLQRNRFLVGPVSLRTGVERKRELKTLREGPP
jgi:hypothetical protein